MVEDMAKREPQGGGRCQTGQSSKEIGRSRQKEVDSIDRAAHVHTSWVLRWGSRRARRSSKRTCQKDSEGGIELYNFPAGIEIEGDQQENFGGSS